MQMRDVLENLRARTKTKSDGDIARLLGVSRQLVSTWKNGKQVMGVADALTAAEILEVDPVKLIASLELERAKSARQREILKKYAGFTNVDFLSGITVFSSLLLFPSWITALFTGVYIMRYAGTF